MQAPEIPSRLTVLIGVLTFGGVVITIAAAPAWAAAAAIAAALLTCVLHRLVWRPRPSTKGVLIVVMFTAAAAVCAHAVFEGGSGQRPVTQVTAERSLLSPGVGQLEAGNIARASLSGASGTYSDPLLAAIGSTVTVAIRLTNGGPDELIGTRVRASIPGAAAPSLSVELVARPRNAHPAAVGDTATINVKGGKGACVTYVSGSTRLFDQHLGLIRDLPDGIVGDGVLIGGIGVPIEDRRFVGLELQVEEPHGDDACE